MVEMTSFSEMLANRKTWQRSRSGLAREETALRIMETYLMDNHNYVVEARPEYLLHIYGDKCGIQPDFSVSSNSSGKIAFFEAKRQGEQGNAHERTCKYFAPGIQHKCAEIAGFYHPFFYIFMDGLTTSRRLQLQIHGWFDADGYRDRYLMWLKRDVPSLINWFEHTIRGYIDDDTS